MGFALVPAGTTGAVGPWVVTGNYINTDSIGSPVVIDGDTYLAGSETIICSDVSITVNGATIEEPDGTVNGAVPGLNSPAIHINSTAGIQG